MVDSICIFTEDIALISVAATFLIFILVELFTFTIAILFVILVIKLILIVGMKTICAFQLSL
jgi:hypothetical protein